MELKTQSKLKMAQGILTSQEADSTPEKKELPGIKKLNRP